MKKHDGKKRPGSRSAGGGWDAEGYTLVGDGAGGGVPQDGNSTRYRTVRRAAREVGVPERVIREWILMGYLGVAPAIAAGYSPFLVNVEELKKVAARYLAT